MDHCNLTCENKPCCKVESVVTVDQRGQMVLPRELRDKANIQAVDKLALISWGRKNEVDYIFLVKSEDLNQSIQAGRNIVSKETIK